MIWSVRLNAYVIRGVEGGLLIFVRLPPPPPRVNNVVRAVWNGERYVLRSKKVVR